MADWKVQTRAPGPGTSWVSLPQQMDLWYRLEVNAMPQIHFNTPQSTGISAPILFYNMETILPDGTLDDISPSRFNGTIHGVTTATGQINKGMQWNSATDYIDVVPFTDMNGATAISFCTWVKIANCWGTNQQQQVWDAVPSGPGNQGTVILQATVAGGTPTSLEVVLSCGGTNFAPIFAYPFVVGTWYHIAYTWNGSRILIYINGVLQSNTTTTGTLDNITSFNFKVGGHGDGSSVGSTFNGMIDELYVFKNVTLSQNQIINIMNGNYVSPYLVIGNEIRVLDPTSTEQVRGMIRESTDDPILKTQKVICSGKAVRLQDRTWQSRRNFPSGDTPTAVLKELMQSAEGEPSAGRVIYYDGETLTSTGLLADLSTSGNNGTFNGSATVGIPTAPSFSGPTPFYGDAIWLTDTSTSFINIPNNTSFDSITNLSIFWWNGNLFSGAGFLPDTWDIFNHQSGNNGYRFWVTGFSTTVGTIHFLIGNGTTTQTFTQTVSLVQNGGWHHYGVTFDGTSVKFWADNAQLGTTQTATITISASGVAAFIGKSTDANTNNIWMDEFYVYNRAIAIAEINTLFGTGILEGGLGSVGASLPSAPPRVEGDRRLQVIDSYCRALGAEWYVDQNASDQDRLNVVSRIGSSTSTQTFQLSKNCSIGTKQINNDTLFNDITIFGSGDGPLQLQSRNFSATKNRTFLTADVTASQTTSMAVTSTTGFPSTGVIYIGMERVKYVGTDATHFGTTSITRAFNTDGISSYPAYAHNSGLEVYESTDTTTVYYTPSSPQTGSQIAINGWRTGVYTDKTIKDQNTLDFLAYNFNVRYNNPREALQITFPSNTLTAVLGDAVTINDSLGNTFGNSPYRLIALEWDWDSKTFRLELLPNSTPHASGGFIDTPSRGANRSSESISDLESYGVVGSYPFSNMVTTSQTISAGTETVINNLLLKGVKNGTKLLISAVADDTTATGTTSATLKIRRGAGTSGTVVATSTMTIGANAVGDMAIICVDVCVQDDPIYTFTVTNNSQTGAGSVALSTISIFVSN